MKLFNLFYFKAYFWDLCELLQSFAHFTNYVYFYIGITGMMQGEKRSWLKNFKVWWQTKNISMFNLIHHNNAVCGLSINIIFETDPEAFRLGIFQIIELYKQQKIKPRIDSVWSFDEVCIFFKLTLSALL